MKKYDKQRMMTARTEWLRRALSSKQKNRWISVEELYREYIEECAQKDHGKGLVDAPKPETYRRWIGGVKFIEHKNIRGNGRGWLKRMYRLKEEQPEKSCLSLLGQKAVKLIGGYLFNGKRSSFHS